MNFDTPDIQSLVWIDMETTGLHETALPLEIALVITDIDGNVREQFERVIMPTVTTRVLQELIETYRDAPPGTGPNIVYNMHQDSGLWSECLVNGLDLDKVDRDATQWLADHTPEYNLRLGSIAMAGNSVWSDHSWIRHSFPHLKRLFTHRNIDISSTKELTKLRHPKVAAEWADLTADSTKPHRAMDDVLHSIREYQFYVDKGMIG